MECSICYSEINAGTGKVELSCSHSFHFSCLTKWFDKQRLKQSCESCPLCRHETTAFEKMPDMLVEDTEEEDDSDDEQETQQDESNEIGDTLTGPAGVWRKTRYGNWVLVSQI
jgi:NADH:ubiquinone oxidoreductase subunit F (NADH-binding)